MNRLAVRISFVPLMCLVGLAGLAPPLYAQETMTTSRVASGLSRPVQVVSHTDPGRLYIVQQRGLVRILDLESNTLLPTPFIDLSSRVSQSGNERGLLGMAFHPDYANTGLMYFNYTDRSTGDTIIAQFQVSTDDPDIADPNSFVQIMTYTQPFSNHNGGWIGFGPNDGYLYISAGDGGSANDPGNRAQDITDQKLGKLLRIDINDDDFPSDPDRNYAIPPTNPFVNTTGDDEIWAFGLRNPWRNSFDAQTGDLWIGDVGQNTWEEIDFQPANSTGGENYGWRCMEATHCTGLTGCTCDDPVLTLPIHEYSHSQGCSVTGGEVYRGSAIPHMRGTYFFADFCSATLWTFTYDGSQVTDFTDRTNELAPDNGQSISQITSFGHDAQGELYICDLGGEVFKIVPRCAVDLDGSGVVDTQDVLDFLNFWTLQDAAADFNHDVLINTQDVIEFLNQWNAGCP